MGMLEAKRMGMGNLSQASQKAPVYNDDTGIDKKRWDQLLTTFGKSFSEAPKAEQIELSTPDQSYVNSPYQETSEERRKRMMDILSKMSI